MVDLKLFLKYAFHTCGIGAVGSLAFTAVLTFIRITTQGYAYFVEPNLLILYFEMAWVVFASVYLGYVFVKLAANFKLLKV